MKGNVHEELGEVSSKWKGQMTENFAVHSDVSFSWVGEGHRERWSAANDERWWQRVVYTTHSDKLARYHVGI